MDDVERERDIGRVGDAHAVLVDHLDAMTGQPGADPTLPSLLPGWTRGHLLTHIARNADSFVRVLDAARRGAVAAQYEGGVEGRNADIEAGSTRDWDSLVADVRSSAWRLDDVFATQDRWDLAMTNPAGEAVPHPDCRAAGCARSWSITPISATTATRLPTGRPTTSARNCGGWRWSTTPVGRWGSPVCPMRRCAPTPIERLCWLFGRGEIAGLEPAGVF